jgi:3-hydroxyisobutyrate dehydrogenase-like beta-hydroxyacid dehydrogenase
MKIAFIGLGNMGGGIAGCIQKAGFDLTVFNRSRQKMEPFISAGAKGGATVSDTVRDADVVITCLMDDKSVLGILDGGFLNAMKPGAIHLGATTISPLCADELARRHKEAGTIYVAGPVVGRPDAAAAGELLTFLAGEPAAIERVTPICKAYCKLIKPISEKHGIANSMKLCVNYTAIGAIELMSEVYAFAERSGVPLVDVNEFFLMLFAHPALKMYTTKLRTRDFDGPMGFAMTGGLKDVNLMGEAHASVGVPFEIGGLIRTKMTEGVSGGMGDRDWSAIYELTRRHAGLA